MEPDRFAGTPISAAGEGETIEVQFTNPDLANSKVTILIHDAGNEEKTLVIPLDGKGNGKADFPIPEDWAFVVLTHPTSADHSIFVGGP